MTPGDADPSIGKSSLPSPSTPRPEPVEGGRGQGVGFPLNQNRDFLHLWAAQTVSTFGTMFGALGLTALIFLDATPGQMGILAMAQGLPALLFALIAGVLVDRLPRRPVLIVAGEAK